MRQVTGLLVLSLSFFAVACAFSIAACAWNSDGKGNIRCGDGSTATAIQRADSTWTVSQAGKNGKTGGSFAIEGQAALYACGE